MHGQCCFYSKHIPTYHVQPTFVVHRRSKSGRLFDASVALLRDAGITLSNASNRILRATASNFPLEVIFLRDDDIPEYVEEGVVDAGIAG